MTRPTLLDSGYVLVHVLEVVVPGQDIGDSPSCEVSFSDNLVKHYPIPSTLQSENIAMPTGGDADPIVQVRAFDSERRVVGVVVVPVNTLVPLEVWNVWYAMDQEDADVGQEEKLPEETSKMHLLLQYVAAKEASVETPQLREMRAQDFLLRALQQLNASLEAKVLVQQTHGSEVPTPAASGISGLAAGQTFQQALKQVAAAAAASGPGDAHIGGSHAGNLSSRLPHVSQPEVGLQQRRSSPPSPERGAVPVPMMVPPQPQVTFREAVPGQGPAARTVVGAPAGQQMHRSHDDISVGSLGAREDRQENADEQDQRNEFASKYRAELKDEEDATQQALASRAALEQELAEFRQELSLRRAHEDSLQKRVALLESELSVVHQKRALLESIDEELQSMKGELAAQVELRKQQEELVLDQSRETAGLRAELWQLRESHGLDLERATSLRGDGAQAVEAARQELLTCHDTMRDRGADNAILREQFADQARQIATLESDIVSTTAMLERQRQHTRELEEKKVDDVRETHSALEDHRQTIRDLREEMSKMNREAEDERLGHGRLKIEIAGLRKELARHQVETDQYRQQASSQEELVAEVKALRSQNEELIEQVHAARQESLSTLNHYEQDLGEHTKEQNSLCQERRQMQEEAVKIRKELLEAQLRAEDLQQQHVRLVGELAEARESNRYCEDLKRQVGQVQDELRWQHAAREELQTRLEKSTLKFREDLENRNRHAADLQKALEERNSEIKLLMYRVQELSSKYVPVKADAVDQVLAKWVNGYKPAVPFFRLAPGSYLFGRRPVLCKISNEKPVFRVGGGFIGFDKLLELYASEELERLLKYETDERTGEPKFIEAQKVRTVWEELQDKPEQLNTSTGGGGLRSTSGSRRSLNTSQ